MNNNELTVSAVNEYARKLLATDPVLSNVSVGGEISGFKRHYTGHLYFTLKDSKACLKCVMFRQNTLGLDFEPQDGQKVVVTGGISLFVRDGAYQLYATSIRKKGIGDLYAQFEQLKNRLNVEGLFDPALKKEIPLFPKKIGLVTSPTGAAVRDMIRVAKRRNPNLEILISPCAVQGEGAGNDVARAIKRIDAMGCDVLLVGRGGGSIEDLWAFNEEVVARAIVACETPVISCVGHEIDFTIADYVADLRAATPSAAAEVAVPILQEKKEELQILIERLDNSLRNGQRQRRQSLDRITASVLLQDPKRYILRPFRQEYEEVSVRLDQTMRRILDEKCYKLKQTEALLRGLDPSGVLTRGYAIVRNSRGKIYSNAESVRVKDEICITMKDGTIRANAIDVEVNEDGQKETEF